MPAYVGSNRAKLYRGDHQPANLFLGDTKITGYKIETSNEKDFSFENSYNSGITGSFEGNSYQASNEASKNLFDKDSDDIVYGYTFAIATAEIVSSPSDWYQEKYYDANPNETYTLSADVFEGWYLRFMEYDEEKNLINYGYAHTITTNENTKYFRLGGPQVSLETLQLELGSEVTDYEPYYPASPSPDSPSEILSVADSGELVLNNFGKNLFNGELSKGYFIDDEFTLSNTTSELYRSIMLYLIAGTYTVSWDTNVQGVRQIKDGIYSSSSQGVVDTNVYTFEVETNNLFGFSFKAYNGEDWDNSPIQIEKGSTATPYTPYVDPITTTIEEGPFRKIDDYIDKPSLDGTSLTVTRNVGDFVFTGEENFIIRTDIVFDDRLILRQAGYVQETGLITNSNGFCNYFTVDTSANHSLNSIRFINTTAYGIQFCLDKEKFPDIETFKQWLAEKYNEGNPIYVYYPSSIPSTETYTIDEFRSRFDYNNISVDDDLLEVVEFNYKVFDK